MTRDEKIRYVALSIPGSGLSETEAWKINDGIGWHPDDVEGEGIFRLSDEDLARAIEQANKQEERRR